MSTHIGGSSRERHRSHHPSVPGLCTCHRSFCNACMSECLCNQQACGLVCMYVLVCSVQRQKKKNIIDLVHHQRASLPPPCATSHTPSPSNKGGPRPGTGFVVSGSDRCHFSGFGLTGLSGLKKNPRGKRRLRCQYGLSPLPRFRLCARSPPQARHNRVQDRNMAPALST
jgi:hypothetical protein